MGSVEHLVMAWSDFCAAQVIQNENNPENGYVPQNESDSPASSIA